MFAIIIVIFIAAVGVFLLWSWISGQGGDSDGTGPGIPGADASAMSDIGSDGGSGGGSSGGSGGDSGGGD